MIETNILNEDEGKKAKIQKEQNGGKENLILRFE